MEILSSRAGRLCRKLIALSSTVLVILWSMPNRVEAAAGDLDPSFGSGGKVMTDFLEGSDEAHSLAIQTDGKIVVVGFTFSNTTSGDFAVARYYKDGGLDSGFGAGGRLAINFFGTGSQDSASSVAVQPDGKIVIGGSTSFFRSTFALVRLDTDGSLDSTFGIAGKVSTDFPPFDAGINAIALQPDGKIVAAGYRAPFTQNGSDFALARYNADGSLDTTFGSGGKVTTDFLSLDDVANAVAIQPDGKIVAVGYNNVTRFAQFLFDFALARYNSDGSLDSSFGSGGKVTTNFFGSYDEARAIVLQPDWKLVVAGAAANPFLASETDFGLVRYESDGSLDVMFGTGGKVVTDFLSEDDEAYALSLQPDGRIIAAGIAERGSFRGRADFALARYNTNGSLDSAFGSGGRVRTDFFGFDDGVRAVALQSDGKIVAAGRANKDFVQGEFGLARYDGVSFDICLQDDSSGAFFRLNSTTGDYQFTNCSGLTLGGTGFITRRGNTITLQQNGPDRRVLARIDGGVNKGTASVQVFSQGTTFTVTDRNTLNNTCSCGAR